MSDAENLRLLAEWLESDHDGEWSQVTSADLRRIASKLVAMTQALKVWDIGYGSESWCRNEMRKLDAIDPNWRGEGAK